MQAKHDHIILEDTSFLYEMIYFLYEWKTYLR